MQDASEGITNHASKLSVASLLSQLGTIPVAGPGASTPVPMSLQSSSITAPPPSASASRPVKDLRNYTFQQALPHLAQLSDDPAFVDAILKVRLAVANHPCY